MPLDTRAKRGSALGFGLPGLYSLPPPDGTIGQGDRQQALGYYSGISAAAAVAAANYRAAVALIQPPRADVALIVPARAQVRHVP